MKKYLLFILILFMPFMVNAEEQAGIANNLNLRVGPSTSRDYALCDNGTHVVVNGNVTLLGEYDSETEDDRCPSKKWYKIKGYDVGDGKLYEGYGCSTYVTISANITGRDDSTDLGVIGETVTAYGTLNSGYVYVSPNTNSSLRSGRITERVPIIETVSNQDTSNSCKDLYKILYNNLISYACKDNFTRVDSAEVLDTSKIVYNYEEELAKFPESYRSYLNDLHKQHPNWRFYAINTNLDFNDVVAKEKNSSYVDSADRSMSYFDTLEPVNYDWSTNTWHFHEANRWGTASKETTAYLIDPRTYFTEKLIFVFEDSRAYTHQTDDVVRQIAIFGGINGNIEYDGKTISYIKAFQDAATFSKVSPMTLIARAWIETGKFKSASVNGTYAFNYNGTMKSGYYNYYNIGAFGANPVANGLVYAYNAGWNNRYKSIVEGASFIANKYIYTGQETQYFQKFNVNPNAYFSTYSHQYQTNIDAPRVEGVYVYWAYKDSGNIDKPVVFHIPVYNNLPTNPSPQPVNGNPNNWLKAIYVDGNLVKNANDKFDGNTYYSYDNTWDGIADETYSNNVIRMTVPWDKNSINIKADTVVSTTLVSNSGDIKLNEKENIIDIVATAENKTTKTYRLIITKQDKPKEEIIAPSIDDILSKVSIKYNSKYMSGLKMGTNYNTLIDAIKKDNVSIKVTKNNNNSTGYFATGDVIEITSGDDNKSFTYVLYGDLNGDGNINLTDLVHVRNIILEQSNLTNANKEAGDINHDGNINLTDLIFVRNHILGTPISQE